MYLVIDIKNTYNTMLNTYNFFNINSNIIYHISEYTDVK